MTPPASGAAAAGRQGESSSKQPLSCANCRHRKIKCDKIQPRCTQCDRSDLDCVFPSRKRNRKPRQARQSELLNRISRLESIVSKVDSGNLDAAAKDAAAAAAAVSQLSSSASGVGRSSSAAPSEMETASAPGWDQPAPAANLMSAEFWENLCQEVEGMRQALDQPSEGDESSDDEPSTTSPESSLNKGLTPPALSGLISSGCALGIDVLKHPPREHILYMCDVFFANIDPAFKILHRPTTSAELEAFANSPNKRIDNATEALFFSMYFGAITSLSNAACLKNLGEERSVLAQRYREGVERALYKADYLNSTELKTLQALTAYVCFLRTHNASRASWALIPLIVRLAQALHLHRDGISPPIPPFEAEMRRRLWWMIVVLDIRAAEDRGTDASIPRQSYNTRLPFNLNDDDFGPSTTAPLEDRTGPTEMTFCLCTSMSSGIFGNLRPRHPQLALDDGTPELTTSEDEIMAHAQRLESLFGTAPKATPPGGGEGGAVAPDIKNLPASHAAVTVRIIILKMWLSAQYPFTPRAASAAAKPRVARETMLRTAVNTIELVEYSSSTYRERFGWWIDSYVQWHPLAVALAELCVQTRGELVERAWKVVDRNFSEMGARIADTRRGTLWRPLKKLLRKARAARAEALMADMKLADKGGAKCGQSAAPAPAQSLQNASKAGNDQEEEDEDVDFDAEEDEGADVEVQAAHSQPMPAVAVPGAGVDVSIGVPVGGGRMAGTAMSVDAPPPNPAIFAPPEDMAMFGGTPIWGHPQDLVNHFGLQMDVGEFSWDWSTWNEFVDDANTERSPGDG
ncbi:fungal specific transcription factor domain-containing protein [Colletotrichum sojae]|uniref:Fungal specific transcription factor domain-containing protein n=1 Tax=Colletotrichum sojae TaxID=2175907 RepID=A0A8H6IRC1_9PEZI|nr:fungal specific transcription factor domain-containing protein [Colletotrichum sojae]